MEKFFQKTFCSKSTHPFPFPRKLCVCFNFAPRARSNSANKQTKRKKQLTQIKQIVKFSDSKFKTDFGLERARACSSSLWRDKTKSAAIRVLKQSHGHIQKIWSKLSGTRDKTQTNKTKSENRTKWNNLSRVIMTEKTMIVLFYIENGNCSNGSES